MHGPKYRTVPLSAMVTPSALPGGVVDMASRANLPVVVNAGMHIVMLSPAKCHMAGEHAR